MSGQISVLHVEDDDAFADLTATMIERMDARISVTTASDAREGLAYLENESVDCIVSDHDMPGPTGIEFLQTVRDTQPDLPFILYTGKGSEDIASEAISAGVTDYLQKGSGTSQYDVLTHRITNAVKQSRARQRIEETEEKLRQIAEKTDDILFMFDGDWSELLFINSAYEEVWGRSVSALDADPTSFLEGIHPDDRSDARESMERLSNGETVEIEYRVIQPDGEQRWIRGDTKPIFDEDGHVERIVGFVRDITEERQHEHRLQKEQAFFEQSLDALEDSIFILDENLMMRRWNEHLLEVTGYDESEVADQSPLQFFPEEEHERIGEALQDVLETGRGTVRADVETADGARIPSEFIATRLTDESGETIGVAGVGRDISEVRTRERKLERAQDLARKTEQLADIGGWEIDTESMEIYWTDNLFELLGIDAETEPPLDEALEVYHEADRGIVETAIERGIESREPFDVEGRYVRPDDEVRWLRLQGVPVIEDDEVVSLRGVFQDITEQRERERALEQAREDYEALFNGMNDTAWVIGMDGTLLAVNDTAVERMGYSREELLSMRAADIDARHESSEIANLQERMPDDEVQIVETVHETKHGREIPVEISSTLIPYRGQTAILSIARDISERKRRERQLREFASVVSHDLRNPLNVASGRLELALEDCSSPHLDAVDGALDRMEALIEDMLRLAREGDEVSDQEQVDLSTIVESAWETVATGSATLETPIEQSISADRSRLQQLFENLLRNAIEHGGESVTVTVGGLEDGFYVADDGPGIPADDREDVFEMGFSTSSTGTGFGLSIVKQIVEAHGWQIGVEESERGGARFEITDVTVAPS